MTTDKILYIVDDARQFLFDGSRFSEVASNKTAAYYGVTSVPLSLVRTHGFKAPREISREKLEIQSEMSMYEEGGLNPEIDFKIDSLTIALEHEESLYVESYAVEEKTLRHRFDTIVKKGFLIDAVIIPALSYKALYAYNKLEPNNDVFIHFNEQSAFAVIFKNGHYIATRAISTLSDLAQKLGIDIEKVRELLTTKGVENERYNPDEMLQMHTVQEELSKVVERIAHSISHKRGIFGLDHIDRFFIDFEGDSIPGFLEMFDSYGYEASAKERLDVFENVESGMKHHALNALYALGSLEKDYPLLNLSIYERKPSFLKTHSGQFISVIVTAILLAAAYPIYASLEMEALTQQEKQLQTQVNTMEKLTQKLRTQLKEERSKRDALKQEYATLRSTIEGYDHMVDALKDFETQKLARQQMMKDVNMAMKTFALSSKYLEQNGSTSMKVHIITPYNQRDNIAKFMKKLLDKGYAYVETTKIERDDTLYESLVEIRP